tara:strand:- start:15218 stop:15715 length:498 start_codon:yes stop_codon:yes gene_type:complete
MNELILALCLSVPALGMSTYKNKKACQYMPQIVKSAKKHEIKIEILVSLIFVESSFRRKAVSNKGACGLTQVMPKYTGKYSPIKKYSCDQLKDPYTSIRAGSKILRWWINYHDGDLKRALCSYNAGFRCGKNKKRKISKLGMKYSRKVLEKANLIETKKNQFLNK